MKAVIMAGGEGTRLRPLTCNSPKPMVPIMNKPVMEHIINLLKKHNIIDIGVTLQYLPEVIKDYFGDGSEFGVNISYFVEDKPLGTAGSVKNAESFLDETFIVISGDALTDINLTRAIEFHKIRRSLATLVLTRVEVPLEYGVVITERDGRITGFLEKPSWSEVFSDTVNTGIYVLDPQCLEYFDAGRVFDFSNDLFPMILNKDLPMYGHITSDYWCDVGDLKAYQQAHFDILDGKVKINIPGYQVQGKIWIDEGVKIDEDCIINGPVVIGANCRIKSGANISPYTILGEGNIIDEKASVKRTIIWDGCTIGHNTQLRGTILCSKVNIKNNAAAFEQSVIGEGTTISDHASVKPGVKVWPHKFVDYGVEVNNNLIWGIKYTKNIFGSKGVIGKANVEITPEMASKLGSSFAGTFKKVAKIGVSYDNNPISTMLKLSLASGMMSLGLEVYDLGKLILPITRDAIRFYGLDGGVYLGVSNGYVNINFLDKNGANISKSLERKIENIFGREDYSRCDGSIVKEPKVIINYSDFYLRNLINSVNSYSIKTMNYKILINIQDEVVYFILKRLMAELNCKFIVKRTEIKGPETFEESKGLKYYSDQVKLEKCDIGVLLENGSEKMILIDDMGRVISEDMFIALTSMMIFNEKKGSTVVVPHSASSVVDKLAFEHGGQVLRTKVSVQDVMGKMFNGENGNESVQQFRLNFDPITSLVNIMNFMAKDNLRLSEMVNMIPRFHMSKKSVECPWNAKGKVMRQLIEDKTNGNVELLEGVKMHKDGGWVLVLPDSERPMCRVISEGYNQEFAESLTDMYVNKVIDISTNEK